MLQKRSVTYAVITMLLSVALFSCMDAGLKYLSQSYGAFQVGFLRGVASLPLVVIWVIATKAGGSLLKVRWSLHVLRGVLTILMMGSFIYALRSLPITTAYTLFFVAPLMITAMSVPLLGEQVGPRRWAAIVIGLVGVIIALRPSSEGMISMAGLAVMLAAFCYSFSAITVRWLARTDSDQAMVFWLIVFLTIGAGALAIPSWKPVQSEHYPVIAAIAVMSTLGQIAITTAFRHGSASTLAPFEYTALIWGVLFDITIWGVLPDRMTWVGAAVIVASGLYIVHRERVRSKQSESSA